MPDVAVSDALFADVVDAITDLPDGRWTVYAGEAPQVALPPFVSVYLLWPDNVGRPLGLEDWGQYHDRWQLSCVGVNAAQSQWLARQIIGKAWPDGWEVVDVGAATQDPEPAPEWWMTPVTMMYRVVV